MWKLPRAMTQQSAPTLSKCPPPVSSATDASTVQFHYNVVTLPVSLLCIAAVTLHCTLTAPHIAPNVVLPKLLLTVCSQPKANAPLLSPLNAVLCVYTAYCYALLVRVPNPLPLSKVRRGTCLMQFTQCIYPTAPHPQLDPVPHLMQSASSQVRRTTADATAAA